MTTTQNRPIYNIPVSVYPKQGHQITTADSLFDDIPCTFANDKFPHAKIENVFLRPVEILCANQILAGVADGALEIDDRSATFRTMEALPIRLDGIRIHGRQNAADQHLIVVRFDAPPFVVLDRFKTPPVTPSCSIACFTSSRTIISGETKNICHLRILFRSCFVGESRSTSVTLGAVFWDGDLAVIIRRRKTQLLLQRNHVYRSVRVRIVVDEKVFYSRIVTPLSLLSSILSERLIKVQKKRLRFRMDVGGGGSHP